MRELNGFIFDLDGTVYLGDRLISGAKETIELLRAQGKKVLFLSNYPLETRLAKVAKLSRLGIEVDVEEVINSIYVLTRYLAAHHKHVKVLPVAESVLIEKITRAGIYITYEPAEADFVVISWDRGFNYDKLNLALQAVRHGAKMIATNPDMTCPVEGGVVPDAGGMIGAIEAVTGKKVDLIAGKPSKIMAEAAIEALGLNPWECIMIGDRLETDILMGKQAGMKTALVMSGVSQQEDIGRLNIRPDYLMDSIAGIQGYF